MADIQKLLAIVNKGNNRGCNQYGCKAGAAAGVARRLLGRMKPAARTFSGKTVSAGDEMEDLRQSQLATKSALQKKIKKAQSGMKAVTGWSRGTDTGPHTFRSGLRM